MKAVGSVWKEKRVRGVPESSLGVASSGCIQTRNCFAASWIWILDNSGVMFEVLQSLTLSCNGLQCKVRVRFHPA